jgi:NADH:ubiquinone oxidoreductase subunit 2 (subunit N)
VKAAAMLALFNIYSNFLILTNVNFSWLLYISSAASMLLGALGAIRVINERGDIRTFIAWTSVNQVGFVLLGLVCFSGEGLLTSFVYLLVYLISSLIFVGVLSRVRFGAAAQTPVVRFEDLRSLFASQPYFSRRIDAFILAYSVWSMAGLPPLAGFFGKLALWSALVRKMSDLLSGDAALEAETAFPFVNYFSEFDPFWALGAILMFSIVISIIGATYYFKLYELLSPAASTPEVSAKQAAPTAYMMHDLASIFVTILLITALSVWVCFVCWDQIDVPFNFPDKLHDLVLGTWSDDFDDMTPFN